MKRLKAIIIGLGNIGMGYDYYENDVILSHANAFHLHPKYKLVAGIDPVKEKRNLFENKFKVKSYQNISGCIKNNKNIDIAAIAVPSDLHLTVFRQIVKYGVKNIICEKPMGGSLNDTKKIIEISNRYTNNVIINYMRRFDPGINAIKELFSSDRFGRINTIRVWYSGNFRNNASHFIDMSLFFLEKYRRVYVINDKIKESPDFLIEYPSGAKAYFNGLEGKNYELLEMEIVCNKGRVKIVNGGRKILIEEPSDDTLFKGYKILRKIPNSINADMNKIQYHVLSSIVSFLNSNEVIQSSAGTALITSEILEQIQNQIN